MVKIFGTNEVAIVKDLESKQDTLVSGTNIKTINNQSILGSGNITIEGGGSGGGEQTTLILTPTYNENTDTLTFTTEQLNQIATSPLEKVAKFEFDGTQYYLKIKTLDVYGTSPVFVAITDYGMVLKQGDEEGVLVQADKFTFKSDTFVQCLYRIGDTINETDKMLLNALMYSGMIVQIGILLIHSGQYLEMDNNANQITLHEIGFGADNILVDKTRIIPQISVQVNDDDTIDLTIN